MNNMESLHNEFEKYFNYNQEKINYFLDVIKNVKEDRWEYETNTEKYGVLYYPIHKTEVLKYNNIEIVCISEHYGNLEDADTDFIITVRVDNVKIFETQDGTSELAIEIIDFIERVEKRHNGKTSR